MRSPDLGRLVPPFPVKRCANADCKIELDQVAFLFTDLDNGGKLTVLCGDCALWVRIVNPERFVLVPL